MAKFHYTVDPQCPDVEEFNESLFGDPMTKAMGAPTDDIMEDFERKHLRTCSRCREYAAANVEIK